MKTQQNESGLFKLKQVLARCEHPEHSPPGHIDVPAGYGYKHICPGCGYVSYIYSKDMMF